jgi:hypothetical protein
MNMAARRKLTPRDVSRRFERMLDDNGISYSKTRQGLYALQHAEGKLTVSLQNVTRDVVRNGDTKRIATFVDTILAGFRIPSWSAARRRIYWELESARVERGDTYAKALSDKVVQLLVVTNEDASALTFVTPSMARSWKVTKKDLFQCAGKNLDALLRGRAPEVSVIDEHKLGMLVIPSIFKTSAILAPGFRRYVEPALGWPVLATIPDRGFIYVIPEKDQALLSRMGRVIQKEFREASYPLSTEVFRISSDGIEAIGAFPE